MLQTCSELRKQRKSSKLSKAKIQISHRLRRSTSISQVPIMKYPVPSLFNREVNFYIIHDFKAETGCWSKCVWLKNKSKKKKKKKKIKWRSLEHLEDSKENSTRPFSVFPKSSTSPSLCMGQDTPPTPFWLLHLLVFITSALPSCFNKNFSLFYLTLSISKTQKQHPD